MQTPHIHGREAISRIIPQRPPFVLVDSIVRYGEDNIVSGFEIPSEHVLVNRQGYLTEAGIIENMAQTVALYQGYDYYINHLPAPLGYIGAIKHVEIFELPHAGQRLETSVRILQEILEVTMVYGEVWCGDLLIARGEMRTVLAKNNKNAQK